MSRFPLSKLLLLITLSNLSLFGQGFHITRLQYGGGGDWYGDPSSLPNLIQYLQTNTNIQIEDKEQRVELTDSDLFNHPYLYLTGHGNIRFSAIEVQRLRDYLTSGGFLHADDNYGMDESFRREMRKVFPHKEWVELPPDHEIFKAYFEFPNGLPKIHEHDGKRPQALALFQAGRIVVLYTYECDLGDGWEDLEIHGDGPAKHEQALKMGTNIVVYALGH